MEGDRVGDSLYSYSKTLLRAIEIETAGEKSQGLWGILIILAPRERGEVNKIKKQGERCTMKNFRH